MAHQSDPAGVADRREQVVDYIKLIAGGRLRKTGANDGIYHKIKIFQPLLIPFFLHIACALEQRTPRGLRDSCGIAVIGASSPATKRHQILSEIRRSGSIR
jgi:hypothetical protein